MIEEDFYATIKLKNGEEIFSKVAPTEESNEFFLILSNPITISEIKTRNGMAYKMEQWLKTSREDIFILNMNDVLVVSESKNIEMITMYQNYVRQSEQYSGYRRKIDRKMGYISNVNDAKEILEKLYRNS